MNTQLIKYCHLCLLLLSGLTSHKTLHARAITDLITYRRDGLAFRWDLLHDSAQVTCVSDGSSVWQGSLLPAFYLAENGRKTFVKARVTRVEVIGKREDIPYGQDSAEQGLRLMLQLGDIGQGSMVVLREAWGLSITTLNVTWNQTPPAIIGMYFGASDKSIAHSLVWPTWDKPFLPDWQSPLFCVPGAKGGTPQSYFRMWDFGQANVALGNFGPSMGSPYGAAYPRPLYYAAMGSDKGYIALGAGSIPDAAMSLRIQSTRGCFEYIYHEDLWGAPASRKRNWKEPLRITLGKDAWDAFKAYYKSFGRTNRVTPGPRVIWNTWGMWGQGHYQIRPVADFAKKEKADVLVLDDGWQSSQGSGTPNLQRFPHFFQDLAYVRKKGLDIGLWESVGWIAKPFAHGLTKADLILDRKGQPCQANWNFDPGGKAFYCLDISSLNARKYIQQRTLRIMKTLKPAVLKLDFMYGLPSPGMGVPRNAAYRGERYGYALFHLIAATAKSVDPDVIIQGYSISPLWINDEDMVSMDDQGDFWYDSRKGHGQWSLWGSLLSNEGIRIGGSSGYQWEKDESAVLNTCILGQPGAVLKIADTGEARYVNRRLAIDQWYRRTLLWYPLWLNSQKGGYTAPPQLNCWGRLETRGADTLLTALVLRCKGKQGREGLVREGEYYRFGDVFTRADPDLGLLRWKGRWALISQDDQAVFSSAALAVIPFDPGTIVIPYPEKPRSIIRLSQDGESVFNGWQWDQGTVILKVSEALLRQTAGFLISKR